MESLKILITTALFVSASLFATEKQTVEKDSNVLFTDMYIQKSHGVVEAQEVLVSGVFPNGCYKWAKAEVEHKDKFTHEIHGIAKVTQGVCIMVMVPFTKEVDLGQLDKGTHTVRAMNGDGTVIEKTFEIK